MTKHIVLAWTLILSLGALSACGQQTIPNPQGNQTQNQSWQTTSNNTQNVALPGSKLPDSGFASAPVVAPPSYGDRPTNPGQSPPPPTLPNGLPALSPLKGVNVDTLFAENISNDDRRFERLENAVIDIRKEFEVMKPAIVRLVAVEEDIQQMIEQLELMASQARQPSPTPVQTQPMELRSQTPPQVPAQPQTQAAQPVQVQSPSMAYQPAGNASTNVMNLRTGIHSDKVRLVMDITRKTPYSVDLDTAENILLIEMPQASWSGMRMKNFGSKTPVISSYSAESINNGQGTRIIVPLKQSTRILKEHILPPNGAGNFRFYVDLAR